MGVRHADQLSEDSREQEQPDEQRVGTGAADHGDTATS